VLAPPQWKVASQDNITFTKTKALASLLSLGLDKDGYNKPKTRKEGKNGVCKLVFKSAQALYPTQEGRQAQAI
jgi:hypothetical protein